MSVGMWTVVGLAVGAAALAVLGLAFLAGRAASLIAGYNMMRPEERARYDERKLCRTMGVMTLACALAVALMAIGAYIEHVHGDANTSDTLWLLSGALIIASIAWGVWRINKRCLSS